MEAKDQLVKLLRIQELASGSRAAREVVESAPGRIEEIEARFRERNAEYVAVKDRHDELQEDQRTRTTELNELETSRKKFMDDLMQVQNQREYSAMLKEIDQVKARIGEHEEAILKDMEELETVTKDLESHTSHIEEERKLVAKERAAVETEVEEARKRIEESGRERADLESELPQSLVQTVHRLEDGRQGQFMTRADQGTCQSCFVRMRPQVFQEVRQASRIHYCGNCKRLLYHESTLKVEAQEEASPSMEPPGLGAMNGESV